VVFHCINNPNRPLEVLKIRLLLHILPIFVLFAFKVCVDLFFFDVTLACIYFSSPRGPFVIADANEVFCEFPEGLFALKPSSSENISADKVVAVCVCSVGVSACVPFCLASLIQSHFVNVQLGNVNLLLSWLFLVSVRDWRG
jgi:hypothetical protein